MRPDDEFLDEDGHPWPDPSTARTVTDAWLRDHCTYLPPAPRPLENDGGRLEQLRRALDDLAQAAGPAGVVAATAAYDALDAVAEYHHREVRRLRAARGQARRQGLQRGRGSR